MRSNIVYRSSTDVLTGRMLYICSSTAWVQKVLRDENITAEEALEKLTKVINKKDLTLSFLKENYPFLLVSCDMCNEMQMEILALTEQGSYGDASFLQICKDCLEYANQIASPNLYPKT